MHCLKTSGVITNKLRKTAIMEVLWCFSLQNRQCGAFVKSELNLTLKSLHIQLKENKLPSLSNRSDTMQKPFEYICL